MRTLLAVLCLCLSAATVEAQTCTVPEPRLVVTGGSYYVVIVDGDSVSAHTSAFAAAAMAVLRWQSDPYPVSVGIRPPVGLIRVEGCRPPRVGPVPPPPPPAPTEPWHFRLVSRVPLADTTRIIVTVELRRGIDSSLVVGQRVRWSVVGGVGGFGNAMSPTDSSITTTAGRALAGWRTVPGTLNQLLASADSGATLSISHGVPPGGFLIGLSVIDGNPMEVDATWPTLWQDSVAIVLIGGNPPVTQVVFAAPGTTGWHWSVPFAPLTGTMTWTTRVCAGPLHLYRIGGGQSCAEHATVAVAP